MKYKAIGTGWHFDIEFGGTVECEFVFRENTVAELHEKMDEIEVSKYAIYKIEGNIVEIVDRFNCVEEKVLNEGAVFELFEEIFADFDGDNLEIVFEPDFDGDLDD